MAIRKAELKDVDAIVDLGVEALQRDPIGAVDRGHVKRTAIAAISTAQHFMWVAEVDGKAEGALGALTLDFDFHHGKVLQVAQFYVRDAARGEGVKLFREMLAWVDKRPAVRLSIASVELGLDPRIQRLLERLGFAPAQVEMIRRRPEV